MADAIADIMMCAPGAHTPEGMSVGIGDVLFSLRRVIEMVGGQRSEFFGKLQRRLATLKTTTISRSLLSEEELERDRIRERGGYKQLQC